MAKTFADYAEQYLEECRYEKANSTFVSEKSKMKNLKKVFGKRLIADITQSDIKRWKIKVHKKFSNKTINEHFIILRSVFSCALGDGMISINPMESIENLKVNFAEPKPFEQHELKALQATETECLSGKALIFWAS